MQIITQAENVPAGYGSSETLRPHVVFKQLLQGLEQAGETVLPRVLYSPALEGAIRHALHDWDADPAEVCLPIALYASDALQDVGLAAVVLR